MCTWTVQRLWYGVGGPGFDSRLVQDFYFCILTGVQMFPLLWQTRGGGTDDVEQEWHVLGEKMF